MFRSTRSVLESQLRESQRRERMLLDMIRELNDRLAAANGNPWTLPPRPVVIEQPEPEDPDAAFLIDL